MSRFRGYKDKIFEIEVPGEESIKIQPSTEDAQEYLLMKPDMTNADTARVIKIFIDSIVRANPGEDPDEIKGFVTTHSPLLLREFSIALGFAKREDFDKKNRTVND